MAAHWEKEVYGSTFAFDIRNIIYNMSQMVHIKIYLIYLQYLFYEIKKSPREKLKNEWNWI